MERKKIIVDEELFNKIIRENIILRAKIEQYEEKRPLQPQIMENQISIEDYIKTLKKEKKKDGLQ